MDRLELIEARWREAGCGDEDKRWLIAEVRALRSFLEPICRAYDGETSNTVGTMLAARCRQPRVGLLARLRRWLTRRRAHGCGHV